MGSYLDVCLQVDRHQNEPKEDFNSQPSVHEPLSIVWSDIILAVIVETVVCIQHYLKQQG